MPRELKTLPRKGGGKRLLPKGGEKGAKERFKGGKGFY